MIKPNKQYVSNTTKNNLGDQRLWKSEVQNRNKFYILTNQTNNISGVLEYTLKKIYSEKCKS